TAAAAGIDGVGAAAARAVAARAAGRAARAAGAADADAVHAHRARVEAAVVGAGRAGATELVAANAAGDLLDPPHQVGRGVGLVVLGHAAARNAARHRERVHGRRVDAAAEADHVGRVPMLVELRDGVGDLDVLRGDVAATGLHAVGDQEDEAAPAR